MKRTFKEKSDLKARAFQLFSPRTPINTADFFAGRSDQLDKTVDAIRQPGAHAIIYGERGVGKTSLANVAPIYLEVELGERVIAPRVNCDGTDDYNALWRKVFGKLPVGRDSMTFGPTAQHLSSLLDSVGDGLITPGVVQDHLAGYGGNCHLVVILDEFDRLPDSDVTRLIADTIKSLSDAIVPVTILVVGVGDSVANLVRGHESVRRHIIEVPLPRMSRDELERIVTDRLQKLGVGIDAAANRLVALLSRGLPYYTHLLGQHAACLAIDGDRDTITEGHVYDATREAFSDSEREMRRAYYEATRSRQPQSNFAVTLAACAMAAKDEFGCFSAGDLRDPMSALMGRPYDIPNYVSHLDRFTKKEYGAILQVLGARHQKRYRFSDPLMEPFVVIKSLAENLVTVEQLQGGS